MDNLKRTAIPNSRGENTYQVLWKKGAEKISKKSFKN